MLLYPIVSSFLPNCEKLKGAEYQVELKKFNIENLQNNSFQNTLNDYVEQNLPQKSILVRLRNQCLYSIFKHIPHINIYDTTDKQLFYTESLDYSFHRLHSMKDEEIDSLINKLVELKQILEKKNAELSIIITPSKTRYIDKNILKVVDNFIIKYSENRNDKEEYIYPYDKFKSKIKNTNLDCFDTIEYIDEHKNELLNDEVPLYYDYGYHWSQVKGHMIGKAYFEHLTKNTKQAFPKINITYQKTDEAVYPDKDLLDLLNLFKEPKQQYYQQIINYEDNNYSHPTTIIRGGSFLGQLPIQQEILPDDQDNILYIDNKIALFNGYSKSQSFENYDELDMKKYFENIDLMILEINEINFYNATFGFLDYILEHKELFERG